MINYANTNQAVVAQIAAGLIQDGVNPFSDDYEFTVKGETYTVAHKSDGIHLDHPTDNDPENTAAAIVAVMMISGVSCLTANGEDVVYGVHVNHGKSRKRFYLGLLAIGGTVLIGYLVYNRVVGGRS